MRFVKTRGVVLAAGVLMGTASAQADVVASYDAGVPAEFGSAGADDPTNQGWWSSETGDNAWAHGYDSGDGGWRTVDGTNQRNVFYQLDIDAAGAALMAVEWSSAITFSMDSDAINGTGGFVDDYFLPPNHGRQNDMTIWYENAAAGYRYILKLQIDEFSDLYLVDGIDSHQLTSDGSAYDNFKSLSITYAGGVATAHFDGSDFVLADAGGASLDRVVFGASSSAGQGSAIWNQVTVNAVPSPSGLAMLPIAGLLCTRRRR